MIKTLPAISIQAQCFAGCLSVSSYFSDSYKNLLFSLENMSTKENMDNRGLTNKERNRKRPSDALSSIPTIKKQIKTA